VRIKPNQVSIATIATVMLCSWSFVFLGHSEPTTPAQVNASNITETNGKAPIAPTSETLSNVVAVKSVQQANGGKKVEWKETPIPRHSATFSNVVASAKEFTAKWHGPTGRTLDWGDPIEVRWQPEPLNRYIVVYPTSETEKALIGERAVLVATNGHACLAPRD
jgi:hypothetical protein